MRRLTILTVLLLSSLGLWAQVPSAFPYSKPVPNDPTTGTTQFSLAKINSSGNAVIMATTDTTGYAGVCVANCGKTGTAWIAFSGLVPITVDGTATIQHYLQISASTGGDGHDSGATSYPTSGGNVIGRVQAGATSGNQAMVDLFPPEENTIHGVNTQTGNYTLTANDQGKLVVMNCSTACTATLFGSPTNGFYAFLESIGSSVATVSLNSKTFNGSASVPVLNSFRPMLLASDGSNYFGKAPDVAGPAITLTPAANGFTIGVTPNGITATQLAAQYAKLRCEPGLGDGLNAMAVGTYLQSTCYNDSGVTWTITGIKCFTDNAGTSTLNATDDSANALLTGAITCGTSFVAGTQSATTTIASGHFIKFTFVSDGASKQTTWVVSLTQ